MRVSACVGLAVGTLAAANVLAHRVAPRAAPAIAVGQVGALTLIARAAGLTPADLGLAPSAWPSGLRWGIGSASSVAAGYGAVLTVPAVRGAIAGSGATPARAVRDAVLTIPLTTVVPEEFAFRGVLFGLLGGNRRAAVASSVLFGLWHMLPALGDGPANATVGDIVGDDRRGVAVRTAGTVLVTAVGGLLMAEVRLRSGSLLAPVLLHWAVNGLGALVAALTGYLDSVGHGHHQDGQQGPDDQDAADPQR